MMTTLTIQDWRREELKMRFKDGRICTDYMEKPSCKQTLWSGNEKTGGKEITSEQAPYTLLT